MNKITIFNMPLIDIVIYKLQIYRLLPWEYGGRWLFQWPTRVWIKKSKRARNANNATITIVLKKRSLLGRIFYLPKAFRRYYKIFRRKNGAVISLYASWIMSGLLIKPLPKNRQ
jgi:hypothetical protein